jgi:hypothetical protein
VGKLATLQQVRREMSRVYRDARNGKITTSNGSRLTFMLLSIAKLLEPAAIEQRVDEIEAKVACLDVTPETTEWTNKK